LGEIGKGARSGALDLYLIENRAEQANIHVTLFSRLSENASRDWKYYPSERNRIDSGLLDKDNSRHG